MDRQPHDYAAAAAAAAAAFAQQQQQQHQQAHVHAQQQFVGFQQLAGAGAGAGVPHSQVPFLPQHGHPLQHPSIPMQFPPYHHQILPYHQHPQHHIPPAASAAAAPMGVGLGIGMGMGMGMGIGMGAMSMGMGMGMGLGTGMPQGQPQPQPQAQSQPQGLFSPWEPPPPPVPPPADADLQKRIDKLAEYAAKNGPDFEKMIRDKQQDNPAYNFLFGAEGHAYYRYKLWLCTRQGILLPPPPPSASAVSMQLHHSASPSAATPFSSTFYASDQQHSQPPPHFTQPQSQSQSQSWGTDYDYDSSSSRKSFKGLSGPLPSDVDAELYNVLNNLSGTKESIKGAKIWFMQRSPFAPALAEALKDRVMALHDAERQLHIIYLANDILFDSLQRRSNPQELDNEALAFQPVLGSMLARIYHNPQNKDANQSRLQKILQFWASKEVYDTDTIYSLEGEMLAGPPTSTGTEPPVGLGKESSLLESSTGPTGLPQASVQNHLQWQSDVHRNSLPLADQEKQEMTIPVTSASQFFGSSAQFASTVSQPFAANAAPSIYPSAAPPFLGSLSTPPAPVSQPNIAQVPNLSSIRGGEQSPYPLFPPGLIPGMVRRMQIGSGVPYSPLSPLDIPTVIPPSTTSPSYILERVSKFFKEIDEVNPSDGQTEDDEREQPSRTGGACIPPPSNLQVDADTGTLPDGSIEHKPGATTTGRLGLGATADPNEVSQYDDVYTSYRKQRSSSYHTSMSARASAR
ncbi:uncharacterized protein LOC131047634 [Cryptomeria japonica]|uniref:uncharacterized protein LOC131047634 n=1 Tax=Cryptomeria japonica TaxID=3369 RepID=UPI0025ACCD39|nr:uncharacterized protein LOC131047634 [Cryptomeria japonica]XP_057837408.1 uncharacterized protein LOC131047634 [Cryptomeria japonica]